MDNFIYFPEEKMIRAEQPNSYFKTYKKFKYKWIDRLWDKVFNYAMKKGYLQNASHTSWERDIKRIELDLNKLDEQIARNQHAIEEVHRNRLECIIVGRDVFHKIAKGDLSYMGYQELTMDRPSKYARYGITKINNFGEPEFQRQSVYYRGLKIKLVPWFEGFLLIPKE